MQTRTKTLLAIALPAALLSSVALAQDQQSQQNDEVHQNTTARQPMTPLNSDMSAATYSHLDKNRDGIVSPEEAAADPSFHTRPAATGGTTHHKKQATAEGQMPPMDESTQDQGMKDDGTKTDDTTTDAPPTPPR